MKPRSSIQQLATVCLVLTTVSSSYLFFPSHLVPKEFALGWIPWHPLCFDLCGLFSFPLSGVIKLKMPTVLCVCVCVYTQVHAREHICMCVCVCPRVWRSDVHWLASEALGISCLCLLVLELQVWASWLLMWVLGPELRCSCTYRHFTLWAFNHLLCKGEPYSLPQNSVFIHFEPSLPGKERFCLWPLDRWKRTPKHSLAQPYCFSVSRHYWCKWPLSVYYYWKFQQTVQFLIYPTANREGWRLQIMSWDQVVKKVWD